MERLGGFWHSPVELTEGEQVLRSESAQVSPSYVLGRLYLTNQRLVWSPFVVYRPLPIEPVIIALGKIVECSYGDRVWSILSQPVDVRTNVMSYKFCIGMTY